MQTRADMTLLRFVATCPNQLWCLTVHGQLLLQRMETVASEKAEVEEKLKESEYTRACYRRDLESSENELSILKGSFVRRSLAR